MLNLVSSEKFIHRPPGAMARYLSLLRSIEVNYLSIGSPKCIYSVVLIIKFYLKKVVDYLIFNAVRVAEHLMYSRSLTLVIHVFRRGIPVNNL